jgi:hypothetical protein
MHSAKQPQHAHFSPQGTDQGRALESSGNAGVAAGEAPLVAATTTTSGRSGTLIPLQERPSSQHQNNRRRQDEPSSRSISNINNPYLSSKSSSLAAPSPSSISDYNANNCQVRVAVRIRPFSTQETAVGAKRVVHANDIQRTITLGGASGSSSSKSSTKERKFTFDTVFDTSVQQEKLYQQVKGQLLGAFLDGYNSTILAYGQTGSGKTYTMGSEAHLESDESSLDGGDDVGRGSVEGDSHQGNNGDNLGLIPRFMTDMFGALHNMTAKTNNGDVDGGNASPNMIYSCSASFLEVYGEEIHDLLSTHSNAAASNAHGNSNNINSSSSTNNSKSGNISLPIREDANGGVVVAGLTEVQVTSVEDALQMLNLGTQHRTTAATWMNRTSSRSHAVFTISLKRTVTSGTSSGSNGDGNSKAVEVTTCSKLTFVDLAGSERMKKTGAEGERAREGIKINEGLLALGNVINALADDNLLNSNGNSSGTIHVPYRQSKLTRLLQDALGGNSQTLFMACVSPADQNVSETLSTLKYANRARNIKNAPTKNVDGTALELQRLNSINGVLQLELVKLKFYGRIASQRSLAHDDVMSNDGKEKISKSRLSLMPDDFDVDEMLQRPDVQDYLNVLFRKAEQSLETTIAPRQYALPLASTVAPPTYSAESSDRRAAASSDQNGIDTTTKLDNTTKVHQHQTSSALSSLSQGTTITDHKTASVIDRGTSASRPQGVPRALSRAGGASSTSLSSKNMALREEIESTSFMLDVNPDQDMAILDQLLELQQQDQAFDESQREEEARVKDVDAELKQQEELLLQLRHSLEVYHDMKNRYEGLVAEVQNLETEKVQLAEQLEKAAADPATGCSVAIRKKLERVEQILSRTRDEKNRHQKMYKKAEAEARKCEVLQRKITDLKQSKVTLIRKQKEAASKHKEFTEAKTKEIQILKKRERQAEQKLTKVGLEVTRYKATLDRRKDYCDKLSSKLKQTEAHLVSVLAMRNKQLKEKKKATSSSRPATTISRYRSLRSTAGSSNDESASVVEEIFALESDETTSASFLLNRMVSDRVGVAHGKKRYEERMADFGKLMREMKKEVAAYNALYSSVDAGDEAAGNEEVIKEHEQNIEDLELRMELVTSDLEDIRSRLKLDTSPEENDSDEINFEKEVNFISKLRAPVVRTVLVEMMREMTNTEVSRGMKSVGGHCFRFLTNSLLLFILSCSYP